jgi:hypothetical protein
MLSLNSMFTKLEYHCGSYALLLPFEPNVLHSSKWNERFASLENLYEFTRSNGLYFSCGWSSEVAITTVFYWVVLS